MHRLRFAPSPTGQVHIGTLRTALFNYIIAQKLNAKLILRIEDTDKSREVEGSVENLVKVMNWIGINFDESPDNPGDYGPYIQSQRLEIYNKHIQELIDNKKAYYCFCTKDRLDKLRQTSQEQKTAFKYDRCCLNLNEDQIKEKLNSKTPYVIRQHIPDNQEITVKDELRGEIKFNSSDLDDHVLIKSDGIPTYQFANVVDDHLMEISHVVRGEEWISSLPKNILLYRAFDWTPPKYVHLPLMLNKNGGKLSKRHGDVAIEDFQSKGYLKETLINFCALQGWHPKKEGKEVYNLEEIIKDFDIADIKTSGAVFDTEKLDYLNGVYIRNINLEKLTNLALPYLINSKLIKITPKNKYLNKEGEEINLNFIQAAIRLEQGRIKKLSELPELTSFLLTNALEYDKELLIWKKMTPDLATKNLEELNNLLEKIPDNTWTNNGIEEAVISHIKVVKGKIGEYLWPMRVALSGKKASPGPFDIAEVLGKNKTLERINTAIKKLK